MAAGITLQELHAANLDVQNSRALGLDGLPVDFNKVFWEIIDGDLLEVVSDSLKVGRLPMSCRIAITLLPNNGDPQDLKNFRLVSLLCTDYKTLSKALAP